MPTVTAPVIEIIQGDKSILLTQLPAEVVAKISYTAVRGQSDEPGAVQRILNRRRISSIRDFTLNIGDFPNSVILNWMNSISPLRKKGDHISFNVEKSRAQIIDGQHRIAGIKEAISKSDEIKQLQLPVAIYQDLETSACADIFLSINTEQKTVPRSLVYDLYGVASDTMIDPAAARARDIGIFLNEEENSPYYDNIKLPGAKIRRGGIALSTAVTAIKPLVEDRGDFSRIGVSQLELQRKIILNYFLALASPYGNEWETKTNAFQYASGFSGAVDFLRLKIIPYGNQIRSFEVKTIEDSLTFNEDNLIWQSEVRGVGGKDAPKFIYERLNEVFSPQLSTANRFKI